MYVVRFAPVIVPWVMLAALVAIYSSRQEGVLTREELNFDAAATLTLVSTMQPIITRRPTERAAFFEGSYGSFDTYYSFRNTTGATLNGTLSLLDTAGLAVATTPLTVPPGGTASANTSALGVTRNRVGTARFPHDGPPGAIVAETAIANFTISPAYVQPVKFQAVREAR